MLHYLLKSVVIVVEGGLERIMCLRFLPNTGKYIRKYINTLCKRLKEISSHFPERITTDICKDLRSDEYITEISNFHISDHCQWPCWVAGKL